MFPTTTSVGKCFRLVKRVAETAVAVPSQPAFLVFVTVSLTYRARGIFRGQWANSVLLTLGAVLFPVGFASRPWSSSGEALRGRCVQSGFRRQRGDVEARAISLNGRHKMLELFDWMFEKDPMSPRCSNQ